jgi:MOSC domain-containing protein YiiM
VEVDPHAIDSKSLRGGHVPLEVVANHPGFGSRLPQTRERELIHTGVGLPEAEFSFDQNGIEDRLQPEPLDLHALRSAAPIRHERQRATGCLEPANRLERARQQCDSRIPMTSVGNRQGPGQRLVDDTHALESRRGHALTCGLHVQTPEAMALRVTPEPLAGVPDRRPDPCDPFDSKRGTALVTGVGPRPFGASGVVQNGVVEIEQNGFWNSDDCTMNTMKLLSVCVGEPREVVVDDRLVRTSIFKSPVTGRIPIHHNNLAGDAQSDLSVHGGRAKAIYAYPHEHYAFWREQLPDVELRPGHFGENLTIEGLLEEDVHVGDRLKIGSAELLVTQPRLPCYKLGIRFGRADMVKRFLASRRTGFYLAVAVEGDLGIGDPIEIVERHPAAISIPELLRMYLKEGVGPARLREVIAVPALSDAWRTELQKQLADR